MDDDQHQQSTHKSRDAKPEAGSPKVATIVSVVYVTAAQTFDGPVGGYTTMGPVVGPPIQQTHSNLPPPSASPQPVSSSAPSAAPSSEPIVAQSEPTSADQVSAAPSAAPSSKPIVAQSEPTSADQSSAAPSSEPIVAQSQTNAADHSSAAPSSASSSTADPIPSAAASISNTPSSNVPSTTSLTSSILRASKPSSATVSSTSSDNGSPSSRFTAASATASPSAAPAAVSDTTSGGMSGGAKAGLALGLLLGIGAILGLVLFCYRRKKKQNASYEKADDEKSAFSNDPMALGAGRASSTRTARTSANAPRLSLRPVTQFSPDFGGRRRSANPLAPASAPAIAAAGAQHDSTAAELPSSSELDGGPVRKYPSNGSDPFGDQAETPVHVLQATGQSTQVPAAGTMQNFPAEDAAGAVADVLPSRHAAPKPLSIISNHSASVAPIPSPAGTEFSRTSTSPNSGAAGAAPASNVHRVQLDFRPSMEDELELRAGQLVRLLHEYDDGWALCIRLDRSQQGVAPRTCLSARPVKPRPAGAGPPRGPPPPGMRVAPVRPVPGTSAPRPMSPASGHNSPGPGPYHRSPRPMSPGPFANHPRSMSPGPYGGGPQRPIPSPGGRRRSNSASQVRERRNSPPGPSPMNPNAKSPQRLPTQPTAGSPQPQVLQPIAMPRKPVPGQAM
ncbi:MAG: hypothetical protein M1830_008138 [Pleopsidium flavum]|nr:MAG: hypothetical protein M1830_008138 [Pleopsidium flavum]